MEYLVAVGSGGFVGLLEQITINQWAMIVGIVLLVLIFFATTRRK